MDPAEHLVVPVVIDRWQMECCGEPPGIGDEVSWRLGWSPHYGTLLPTDLDITATVASWDPGDDDPNYGDDATARRADHRASALATYGPLRVFTTLTDPLPTKLRLSGVLHEDHHVDTPLNLPTTTGTVRTVHLVSFEHDLTPGENSRTWEQVPGTEQLTSVTRSLKWLPYDEPADGQTTGWRSGPSYILVGLAIRTPSWAR